MSYSYISNANPAYIEDLYRQYQADPASVDKDWARFFEGYDFSNRSDATSVATTTPLQDQLQNACEQYRQYGHYLATVNPIKPAPETHPALDFKFSEADLNTVINWGGQPRLVKDHLETLAACYCSRIGSEFTYCAPDMRAWIAKTLESTALYIPDKLALLDQLADATLFESFLHTKYVGQKRFSLEGLDVIIPGLHALIAGLSEQGAQDIVMGMAHRGRLNVLAHILGKPYETIFREFDGSPSDDTIPGDGDVKYHLGYTTKTGDTTISLLPNPSHLEAVNSVVQGAVYAKRQAKSGDYTHVVPVLIHGDAALSGQGVNYEVSNMSNLPGYANGGSIHIVANNQLGYTTPDSEGRSSTYCTDIAKLTGAPVFHVSADDPISVVQVMRLAASIRQQFATDVYIDIIGYRRYGHNEGDEPRFTQPALYETLATHPTVYTKFSDALRAAGEISQSDSDALTNAKKAVLNQALTRAKQATEPLPIQTLQGVWQGYRAAVIADFDTTEPDTSTCIRSDALDAIAKALYTLDNTAVIPKVKKIIANRKSAYDADAIDWALAEQLAYGSVLQAGSPVRLSGQDAQRGTFSHRHAVLQSPNGDMSYTPLNHIQPDQGRFSVHNSLLSEYAVLGFELGHSWAQPAGLTLWEAQFGDFCNGAQIIIDQFIASAASKWYRFSGLVLLLPHGYEGMGPEHSSARLERFLQLSAGVNLCVSNITTPANLFHALRRQYTSPFRVPLVIMSPKSLLRHPEVISPKAAFTSGGFQAIIDDVIDDTASIKTIVFCSGKLFYELNAYRDSQHAPVALIRIEQLHPFPTRAVQAILARYTQAKTYIWAQEEPENQGPWQFIRGQFPADQPLVCVSRPAAASPAVGNAKVHATEQEKIIKTAIKTGETHE